MKIEVNWRELADDIRERLAYGDTLRSASKEIGIELHQIYRLMAGKPIRTEAMLAICLWLGRSAESFIVNVEATES